MKLPARHVATLLAVALMVSVSSPSASAADLRKRGVTTVILVRHAEKTAVKEDPSLTPEGQERARLLAHMLSASAVKTIYVTPFARTRQTAAPTAALHRIAAQEIAARPSEPEIVARIRSKNAGETVLVVGHSNTIPILVKSLGCGSVDPIADGDFDNLYICSVPARGKPHLVELRYGRETP